MRAAFHIIWFLPVLFFSIHAHAQDDKKALANGSVFSRSTDSSAAKDTSKPKWSMRKDTVRKHDPRIATRRSAIIPGWGQAYNREYWKIPLVYGVLAIPVSLYFYNNSYYKKTKFAYEARYKAEANPADTADLALIDPQLKNLGITSLQTYRNSFRRDRDYSVLWFLLAWGLQVMDATVFAHLKQFDVSNDLSMDLNPTFNPITRTPGLGLTLSLKNASSKRVVTR
jgi:hypothetical protein